MGEAQRRKLAGEYPAQTPPPPTRTGERPWNATGDNPPRANEPDRIKFWNFLARFAERFGIGDIRSVVMIGTWYDGVESMPYHIEGPADKPALGNALRDAQLTAGQLIEPIKPLPPGSQIITSDARVNYLENHYEGVRQRFGHGSVRSVVLAYRWADGTAEAAYHIESGTEAAVARNRQKAFHSVLTG